jgi:FixJ family two-component response regulator
MSGNPPTVHVVDDDSSFRGAICRLLRTSGYQVAAYETADQLLQNQPKDVPGCILLDVHLPGLSGPDLQNRLKDLGSVLPIVFMSGQGDIPTSVRTIKAGAEDFLTKPIPRKVLLASIDRALLHCAETLNRNARHDRLQGLVDTLTPREKQVFALMVRGRLNKQIAYELDTSERTIKAHRHVVMEKLQIKSSAEAATIAERLAMLTEVGNDEALA